jgi:hypothetical protein
MSSATMQERVTMWNRFRQTAGCLAILAAALGGAQSVAAQPTAPQPLAQPAPSAGGDVVRIEQRQFRAGAGLITFRELPVGTRDPVYPPSLYGGDANSPTVRFSAHFAGRHIASARECPPGAARTGCLAGTTTGPLQLAPGGTKIWVDGSVGKPVLSGTPTFNGPIAVLFDHDVAAVGINCGAFDAVGGTAITIYDRQGKALGETRNRKPGIEFLGLATRDLKPRIAGLEFHIVGAEPNGFAIDDIRFGYSDQIDLPTARPPIIP